MWQIILRGVPRWVDAGTEQQMRQTMLLYSRPWGCPVVTRLSIIGWQQVPRTPDAHRRIVGGCTSDRGQHTTVPCNGCNHGKFMTIPIMMSIGLVFNLLLGAAIAFVCGIVLKKEDPNEMVG